MTALGRPLPVMATKPAGQIRSKLLVKSNANGWASLCNYLTDRLSTELV